jgi:hypothetical protein
MNCLHFGHIACFCRVKNNFNQTLPLQHVVSPSPSPSSHVKETSPTDVSLQSVLAEQAELLCAELQGFLARVGSFLARAEATLGKPLVVSDITPLDELHVGSTSEGEANLFGFVSPRARPSMSPLLVVRAASMSEDFVDVLAPVLQIM